MKVKVITEDGDFGYERLEIEIDGTTEFEVSCSDESPEDNNLSRNFADCFSIEDLIKLAYEAGKNGEELEFEYEHADIE